MNLWFTPDEVFGFAADVFEVQLQFQSVQGQVPQSDQFTHLVGERSESGVPAHVQRGQSLQQPDLRRDLNKHVP